MAEATRKSKNYDWTGAAELYQQAIEGLASDAPTSETGRIMELLASSYFKASYQSESYGSFIEKMSLSRRFFEKAADLYKAMGLTHLSDRLKGRASFTTFWLTKDVEKKRSILDECIHTAEEAVAVASGLGDRRQIADAYRDLLTYLVEARHLAPELSVLKEQFEKAVQVGDDAIREFEALGDDQGLLESLHVTLIFLTIVSAYALEPQKMRELAKKTELLEEKMNELSNKVGSSYAICLSSETAGWRAANLESNFARALKLFEAGREKAVDTRDSYLIGRLAMGEVYTTFWLGYGQEDVDERRELFEKGINSSTLSIANLEIPCHSTWLGYVYEWYTECHSYLGILVETERERKRANLWKAVEVARKGNVYRNNVIWGNAGHALSKGLYFLATIDGKVEERAELLREALPIRVASVQVWDRLAPGSRWAWNRGVMRNYLALIKAELSSLETDPKTKNELLQEAVSDMQQCVDLCSKWAQTPNFKPLAGYLEWYGDILLQLSRQNNHQDPAHHAVKAYRESLEYLDKSGQLGPIGGVKWKIAKAHDILGNYNESSQAFTEAAQSYRLGAAKIPGLASAFEQFASYMDAWARIENARVFHNDEDYVSASREFAEAAKILQQTNRWNHLAQHYVGCSHLEQAELFSRSEKNSESIEAFSAAVRAFEDLASELGRRRADTGPQEEGELKNWQKVTDARRKYCLGRINLEEAVLVDRKGNKVQSSKRFLSASQAFRALLEKTEDPRDKRELETLSLFCEAWTQMKEAEAEASPDLFARAADSFMKAKAVATEEKLRYLSLANSAICRALEDGTRFRLTRHAELYSEVKKHLATASDYYEGGGFVKAASWTRATQRLFDALLYLNSAETEADPEKRAEFFGLAERHFQLAARLYDEAGFSTRRDEALTYLSRIREEKEILVMPEEALSQNPAVSAAAITPVSLTGDQALGMEGFEGANIVGNLSLFQTEAKVGSEFTYEIEIANLGKTTGTLVKVENVVPEGFVLDRQKNPYRFEDGNINMRGKRLEYLKTHEFRIVLRASRKGSSLLSPRILYVDERGNSRSCKTEPVTVAVRELGISGWIRGR